MKIGVLNLPGSDLHQDLIRVFQEIMNLDVTELWHKNRNINNVDIIFLAGKILNGSGVNKKINSLSFPAIEGIQKFAEKGKPVIGTGYGFQLLCEIGLLPGKLLMNKNTLHVCTNTHVKIDNNKNMATAFISKHTPLNLPVSTKYGRYATDEEILKDMRQQYQILFRFCDDNGQISKEVNPTGSMENIAGICNKGKNVFGIIPMPERAVDWDLGNAEGMVFFNSIIKSLS